MIAEFHDYPGLKLGLYGSAGRGGCMRLIKDGIDAQKDLAPALFDTLWILGSRRQLGVGHVTIEAMERFLKVRTALTPHDLLPEPALIARYILRIRKLIGNSLGIKEARGTSMIAKSILQKHAFLGYRLAIAPDAISLLDPTLLAIRS